GRVSHVSRLRRFGLTRPRRGVTTVLEATAGSFKTLGVRQGATLTWSVKPVSAQLPRRDVMTSLLRWDRGAKKTRPKAMTAAQRKRSVTSLVGVTLLVAGGLSLTVGAIVW